MTEVRFFAAGGGAVNSRIDNLGSGTYSHVGFYGSTSGSSVLLTNAQDTTTISDSLGNLRGSSLPASGELVNNKWIDASGVSINDDSRIDLSSVVSSGSGTFRIEVSGTTPIELTNTKLFAYDGTTTTNDPSGVYVLTYEIIGSAASGTGDTQWALIDATNYNQFVDRRAGAGYDAANVFDYIVGVSVRPQAGEASGLTTFGFLFQTDFV